VYNNVCVVWCVVCTSRESKPDSESKPDFSESYRIDQYGFRSLLTKKVKLAERERQIYIYI